MADNVQVLLNEESPAGDPKEADTAVFYSISNAQMGLTGISFGNFLIKRVVARLSSELSNLKTFATLSPLPGFRKWLDPLLEKGETSLFTVADITDIKSLRKGENAAHTLLDILNSEWHIDEDISRALRKPLMSLAGRYLLQEKRRTRALDPVAHFHITNGARLERINWLADTSPKGMRESAGMMANYLYKLSHIDNNHEAYVTGGMIKVSKQVRATQRK
jgi:malonyl-CoA decarboxylase